MAESGGKDIVYIVLVCRIENKCQVTPAPFLNPELGLGLSLGLELGLAQHDNRHFENLYLLS